MSTRNNSVSPLLEAVRRYLGETEMAAKLNIFGRQTGTDGSPWAGSLIDVAARDAGLTLPSSVYPPSALAEYIRLRRTVPDPAPGDIVFYGFSLAPSGLGMPHIGVVSDVTGWKRYRAFKAIEGDIGNPGKVAELVRYESDILAFARPNTASPEFRVPNQNQALRVSEATGVARKTRMIQEALAVEVGLRDALEGVWDAQTKRAYARWQRKIGYTETTGLPDYPSLRVLAQRTGLFQVTE